MSRPRKSKSKSKREKNIKEGMLPAGTTEGETSFIPLGEMGGVEADEPVIPPTPNGVSPLPPPPVQRHTVGHVRVGLGWSPFNSAQEVLDALNRSRIQNELNDHSNSGGPEYTTDNHGVVHPNYLRRR